MPRLTPAEAQQDTAGSEGVAVKDSEPLTPSCFIMCIPSPGAFTPRSLHGGLKSS